MNKDSNKCNKISFCMKCNPIPAREDWFITDRKPTIYLPQMLNLKGREVGVKMLGMPIDRNRVI